MTSDRTQAVRNYVKPHPLDLDQVSARLLNRPADRERLPPASPTSTETVTSEDEYLDGLMSERECYHELANDGGRPWYEISLLEDVARRPEEYREMLLVWQTYDDNWRVFAKQLARWRQFRTHQQSVRGEDKLPQYVKALKKRLARNDFTKIYQLDDDLLDNDPGQQGELATWIEYLNFEYWGYEYYARIIRRGQRQYLFHRWA